MVANLRTPERRTCERCGREEGWDPEAETWRVRVEEGRRLTGDPYCVHEWDIDGSFRPVEE